MKPGSRVGALLSVQQSANTAELFGYGVYDGHRDPPAHAPEWLGKNPHITLDNGKEVWGFECWWGPEDEVKQCLEGMTVTNVDIEAVRNGSL